MGKCGMARIMTIINNIINAKTSKLNFAELLSFANSGPAR
jgi:hypothetical protein